MSCLNSKLKYLYLFDFKLFSARMNSEPHVSDDLPVNEAPSQPASLVYRIVLGLFYITAIVYFGVYFFQAISTVSLSQGFQNILDNPWATSALVDYVTWVLCVH